VIFKQEMIDKILAGEKTATRRPVKWRFSESVAGGLAKIRIKQPCRCKKGRSYAIQPGRGQKAVGRIRITSVSEVPLGEINHAGAKREGFPSVSAFFSYWITLYDLYKIDVEQRVWRIEFELLDHKALNRGAK
jgi:hypothetical protein